MTFAPRGLRPRWVRRKTGAVPHCAAASFARVKRHLGPWAVVRAGQAFRAAHRLGAVALARRARWRPGRVPSGTSGPLQPSAHRASAVRSFARVERHLGALAAIRMLYFRTARSFACAAHHLGTVAPAQGAVGLGSMSSTTSGPWRLPGARWQLRPMPSATSEPSSLPASRITSEPWRLRREPPRAVGPVRVGQASRVERYLGAMVLARCVVAARARAAHHLGAMAPARCAVAARARAECYLGAVELAHAENHLGAVELAGARWRLGPAPSTISEPCSLHRTSAPSTISAP